MTAETPMNKPAPPPPMSLRNLLRKLLYSGLILLGCAIIITPLVWNKAEDLVLEQPEEDRILGLEQAIEAPIGILPLESWADSMGRDFVLTTMTAWGASLTLGLIAAIVTFIMLLLRDLYRWYRPRYLSEE